MTKAKRKKNPSFYKAYHPYDFDTKLLYDVTKVNEVHSNYSVPKLDMNKVFSDVPESADPNGGGWAASTWREVHPYQKYKTGPASEGVPRVQDSYAYNPNIGFDNPEASIGFNLHSRLNPIVRTAATSRSETIVAPALGD